jgi:hypothetical protein
MGTRSLTHFKDYDGTIIATMYRQFDGYPEGHGADLVRLLGNRRLVDGIPLGEETGVVNGIGCAASLVVAGLKQGMKAGNIYLVAPGTSGMWEQYVYTVYPAQKGPEQNGPDHLRLKVGHYDGPLADLDPAEV